MLGNAQTSLPTSWQVILLCLCPREQQRHAQYVQAHRISCAFQQNPALATVWRRGRVGFMKPQPVSAEGAGARAGLSAVEAPSKIWSSGPPELVNCLWDLSLGYDVVLTFSSDLISQRGADCSLHFWEHLWICTKAHEGRNPQYRLSVVKAGFAVPRILTLVWQWTLVVLICPVMSLFHRQQPSKRGLRVM